MRVVVAKDAAGLAERAAAHIAELIAVAPGPRVSLGLAGGSTPRATYEKLRDADIDWTVVDAWLGDERWVAPDHKHSNARMAREVLLDHVPAAFLDNPWCEGCDPKTVAEQYAADLDRTIGDKPDIVLLGMGDDGHTASLFPGTTALEETQAGYAANLVPEKGWRLTATLPLLHRVRKIIFLVSGEGKADILAQVLRGAPYPSTLVAEGADDVTWFVDEAAASCLELD